MHSLCAVLGHLQPLVHCKYDKSQFEVLLTQDCTIKLSISSFEMEILFPCIFFPHVYNFHPWEKYMYGNEFSMWKFQMENFDVTVLKQKIWWKFRSTYIQNRQTLTSLLYILNDYHDPYCKQFQRQLSKSLSIKHAKRTLYLLSRI